MNFIKQQILDECIKNVTSCLDDVYAEVIENINDFNAELDKRTEEYLVLRRAINKAVEKKKSIDFILSLIEEIEQEDLIANKIKLRQAIVDDVAKSLPKSAKKIANSIQDARDRLSDYKDGDYLISLIEKKVYDNIKVYNQLTVSSLLNDNWHLDVYIGTRNDLVKYIETVMKEYVEVEIEQIEDKEVKQVKFKQRLRVTYDELQKFAKHMGYEEIRQGNTTHKVWRHPVTGLSNPIPNKSGTVPQGTVSRILKQMELTRADLAEFLYS